MNAACAALVALLSLSTATSVQAQKTERMKAVRIHQFGTAAVLRVDEVERLIAGPGELLVRVHAAGVNPVDVKARRGLAQGIVAARFPYTLGFDVSGTVVQVGEGVSRFRSGDEVYAMIDLRRGGAYAEYVLLKEGETALKPRRASHPEAAALPLVALTAWQALIERANVQRGQTVLVHAGAGGVGSVAVQLAKWRGARVIATASASNHDFLRSIGADVVIDYRALRFEEIVRDVDVVLDPVGDDTQTRSLKVLKPGGIIIGLNGLTPAVRNAGVRAVGMLVEPSAAQLERIASLVDERQLRPIVSHRFPLQQVAAAHEQSETGHTRGKIILEMQR